MHQMHKFKQKTNHLKSNTFMKKSSKILSLAVVVALFVTSCQDQSESPSQLADAELANAESEAIVESTFEDVDDISYESLFYTTEGGRIADDPNSPLTCAVVNHDKEGKTITVDFGNGCEGPGGRVRSGKIIITYTARMYVPGAVVTTTFENYICDGRQIEGTRTRTNLAESTVDTLACSIQLENGKVTWEDGTVATRDAYWTITRVRSLQPINDLRIRTGYASGVTAEGVAYTSTITKPIVWKRGCQPARRVMIPVEGTRVLESENHSYSIDYGDGSCDNIVHITKDGQTKDVEITRQRKLGK
jgi:hypothetical protein